MAACAATLALPAYVRNAELNIQVHGGIGFTWEHDAHLHLRRAITTRGLLGGRQPAADVYTLTAKGVVRPNSIDLPPMPSSCAPTSAPSWRVGPSWIRSSCARR